MKQTTTASLIETATHSKALPSEYSRLERPWPSSTLENPYTSLFNGLFLIIFLPFMMSVPPWSNLIVEYKRLSHEVEATDATISHLNKDESGDSTTCRVNYGFKAPDKNGTLTFFQKSETIPCHLYNELKVEQQIEILYVTSDPTVSVIKSEHHLPNWKSNGIIFFLLSLFYFLLFFLPSLFGLGYIYSGLITLHRRKLLRVKGQQTQAILFDRWEEKDSEGAKTYYVAYAFKIPTNQGEQIIITRAEENRKAYRKFQIGDTPTVCYLPEKPEEVCRVILKS